MEFIPQEIDGEIMVLAADGGLDSVNAAAFVRQVEEMVAGGFRQLIIDCGGLTHLSSVGLGTLLRLHARLAKQGGDVRLCGVTGFPMQVLRAMRLDRVFEVYDDVDQARAALRRPPKGESS